MRLVDAVSLRSRRQQAPALPGRDARRPRRRRCSTSASTRSASARDGGQSGCGTHNFFEELYPWPSGSPRSGSHDGAGFRASYPTIALRAGRRAARCRSRTASFDVVFSNAVIEHVGDVERQRLLRRRGAARRPPRVRDDAEPLVPDRGAHAAAARPLAARRRRRPRVRPRRQGLGEGEPPARPRRPARASSPAPVRIVNLGLTLVAIT